MEEKNIHEHIKETFLELYKKKSVDKIQANEIIEESHIGRSTFYKYYKNVYDILKSIESTIFNDMKNIYEEYNFIDVVDLPENTPAPNFYETYKYILKHKDFYEGAFSNHGNYLFKRDTKNNIIEKLNNTYKKYFEDQEMLDTFSDYISELIIDSCSIILRHSDTIDAKSLSIKTKKAIVDFIKNKDLYFKKKEK